MLIKNPIMMSDYPDPDMIRIGDAYYLITTTMFFAPVAPIMKSYDLVHWEIVTYVTDTIEEYDTVGIGYGRGQWATSMRQRGDTIYVFFSCLDLGKSYLFSTKNIESRNWDRIVFNRVYHDSTIFFDDNGAYLIYKHGSTSQGDIRIVQFKDDMSGIMEETDRLLFITPMEGIRLAAEGARGLYKDGWYYLFFIDINDVGERREWCYRSRDLYGPYDRKLITDGNCGPNHKGVAQGSPVDTPEGDWYMILFGGAGTLGRIPYMFPLSWEEDWPVLGAGEGMKLDYDVPMKEHEAKPLIQSDSFSHDTNEIGLFWQWNHNPDNTRWSFTENPGKLTLHAAPADGFMNARNSLSQRTCGPGCAFTVALDVSELMPGDIAGIAALQWDYANAGVVINPDGSASLKVVNYNIPFREPEGTLEEVANIALSAKKLYLKAAFYFTERQGTVQFFYSVDGKEWTAAGDPQVTGYNLRYFVGTRVALFCYGSGGGNAQFADFTAEVIE